MVPLAGGPLGEFIFNNNSELFNGISEFYKNEPEGLNSRGREVQKCFYNMRHKSLMVIKESEYTYF